MLAAVYGPHDMRESRLRPQQDKGTVNCQYSMAVFRWSLKAYPAIVIQIKIERQLDSGQMGHCQQ